DVVRGRAADGERLAAVLDGFGARPPAFDWYLAAAILARAAHPFQRLVDGYEVVGVDCFNDNYARAEKEANLARAREHDRFRLLAADLVALDARRLLDGSDV